MQSKTPYYRTALVHAYKGRTYKDQVALLNLTISFVKAIAIRHLFAFSRKSTTGTTRAYEELGKGIHMGVPILARTIKE